AIVGSTAGNLFLFSVARRGGQLLLRKRIASKRAMQFRTWFDRYGLLTVFISALVPLPIMPMKIFVLCAGALGSPILRFALVFIAARVPRYLALAYLGRAMGDNALAWLRDHVLHLTAFGAALFLILWLMIRFADKRWNTTTAPE
ncbi:MAG: VTT domain-containing protein, partial [Bryobacteraceae bacterium]|nr:VTT domain-containing protein [Bryobacteraceae bacterium]